jgi:hypothetical protein
MAQPLPYERDFDFESYQAGAPSTPLPGLRINQELEQVAATIDEVLARIAQLQDDDNRLKRLSVGFDQLAPEVRNGFTTPTVWATGVQYVRGASVYRNQRVYAAVSAHVSSAFATDLANGRWVLLADFTELTVVSQGVADNAAAAAAAAANALSYRDSALSAKSDAEAAATVSSAASSAAIAARDLAELWASEDEDVVVAGGRYSALHWAQKAEATVAGKLSADQNLGDLVDPAAGRDNLGLGSAAVAALIDDPAFTVADDGNVLAVQNAVALVATRAALVGLPVTAIRAAELRETGRRVRLQFISDDLSAYVLDDNRGPVIAPTSDPTGASGAWVMMDDGANDDGVPTTVWLDWFKVSADTDDTDAWEYANDYIEAVGGGELCLRKRVQYIGPATLASKIAVKGVLPGLGTTTIAWPSGNTNKTSTWFVNRDVSPDSGTRLAEDIGFAYVTFDGSNRPLDRWLSQADGTPVTDPEADYVMGTGALASGIADVSLTAVLTGDAVTSLTINNGGSGWNGHPTHPYLPTTVPLRFEGGGGTGARGFATIVAGTLISGTIENVGSGYVSPPTVTPMGGYADISLLVEPSINRRNPNYATTGDAIVFDRVQRPYMKDCKFLNVKARVVNDAGCLDGTYSGLTFEGCGKRDGPFHCLWVQSKGNPLSPPATFQDTENALIENIKVIDAERSAILFAPTKGGTIRRLHATGCGESTIFIAGDRLCRNGGQALIENCYLADNVLQDIAAQLIEAGGCEYGLTIRDNTLKGSALPAAVLTGANNVRFVDNTLIECVTIETETGDGKNPFGPFAERYGFATGTRPIAGQALSIAANSYVTIGTIGALGTDGLWIERNTIIEGRATYPTHIFEQTKNSDNNLSKNAYLCRNNMTRVPSGMGLLKTTNGNVWATNMPLWIQGNLGHASEAPVVVNDPVNASATGARTYNVGFRPSIVHVYASNNNGALGQQAIGAFTWPRTGTRNDFCVTLSTLGDYASVRSQDVARLVNSSITDVLLIEFTAWTETGFTINVQTAGQNCLMRLVCIP